MLIWEVLDPYVQRLRWRWIQKRPYFHGGQVEIRQRQTKRYGKTTKFQGQWRLLYRESAESLASKIR